MAILEKGKVVGHFEYEWRDASIVPPPMNGEEILIRVAEGVVGVVHVRGHRMYEGLGSWIQCWMADDITHWMPMPMRGL